MTSEKTSLVPIWKESALTWAMLGLAALLTAYIFYDGIEWMVSIWSRKEEYGYGYLIPVIVIFFIWNKKDRLSLQPYEGSWFGVALVLAGMGLAVLGELSTLYIVLEYGLIIVIAALVLARTGWSGFKLLWIPLLFLVFMIPLPQFIYQGLSAELQLISSGLGVEFIRLLGVSVHLEGNVIDLGSYRLQVVEACSGLRYLFPLASLAFIAAYIYKAPLWKKAVIFLSSIPITIIMNSFRIGVVGFLVDTWGQQQAEGFLHYFEGWVIFMACMVILILEIWGLNKIGGSSRPLTEVFSIEFPEPAPENATYKRRTIGAPFIASVVLLLCAAILIPTIQARDEIIPARRSFDEFPMVINEWNGRRDALEGIYIDALKFKDYLLADYSNESGPPVSLYVAYYESQKKGESAHSPRTCLPGGGWKIKTIERVRLDSIEVDGSPLFVNRAEIVMGEYRQLVYYWFHGRGRIITNEYLVKWYLFWDSLTSQRTDGALVRLTTYIGPHEDMQEAENKLSMFVRDVSRYLGEYVPGK